MEIQFYSGDISEFSADAIVLPANENLREGSGSSEAIFKAAGRQELTQACAKIGHCDVGHAVPTQAFHLNANFIIHAVVPRWIDGQHNEYDLLCSAYLSSLYLADTMSCSTIAFPLLASGNNRFDRSIALEIAVQCIESFNGRNLKKACVVLFGDRTIAFVKDKGYEVTPAPVLASAGPVLPILGNRGGNRLKQIGIGYQKAGQKIIEDALERGLQWIENPANEKIILDAGEVLLKGILKAFHLKNRR